MAEIKNLLVELEVLKHNNKMLSNRVLELQAQNDRLRTENEALLSKDDSLKY